MERKDLLKKIKEDGVKFISFQFTDVNGVVKSLDAPVERLEVALDEGIWFDGSSVEGFCRIQESDMLLQVDQDSYAVLPWSPVELRRGRFFCDIFMPDGTPFNGDPRGVLKRSAGQSSKKKVWYSMSDRNRSSSSSRKMAVR